MLQVQTVQKTPWNPQDRFSKNVGENICFIGNECEHWTLDDFRVAARYLKSFGFDSMAPKKFDGTILWYKNMQQVQDEFVAVTGLGVGYIPVGYCYGPRFGMDFIDQECAVLQSLIDGIAQMREELFKENEGFAVADMEIEWNNEPVAAERFTKNMLGKPGLLGVTTWADPEKMGWDSVIEALKPCVNAWIPQEYNTWLASDAFHLSEHGIPNIECGIDISQEFGPNNQMQIIQNALKQGDTGIWYWDYSLIASNRNLVRTWTTYVKNH